MAKHLKKKRKNLLLYVATMVAVCLAIILFTYQKVQSPVIKAGQADEMKY